MIEVVNTLIADSPRSFVTRAVPSVRVELGGIPGDRHYGLLRPADVRQKIYPRGTPIANRRQISIVSLEECAVIAERMGVPLLRPEWFGANLMLSGLERLTSLEAGARLVFPDGTGLICEGENEPCSQVAKVIASQYERDELRKSFVPSARRLRGIVCSVEREGVIAQGDVVALYRG
ncbi:MOSC domain-containing protein [Paenibacillus sp. TRM 82003]|nr:MOSC domain-containing protein [Paenibacillus sp. TRM 82003]